MSHFITLTCLAALGFMSAQAETTNNKMPIMNEHATTQEALTPGEQALTRQLRRTLRAEIRPGFGRPSSAASSAASRSTSSGKSWCRSTRTAASPAR